MHLFRNGSLIMPRLKGSSSSGISGSGRMEGVFQRDLHWAFHRLTNFKAYTWQAAEQRHHLKVTYPGIYDVVKYLGKMSNSFSHAMTFSFT